ncbi:alkaline phosphatase PhoX [Chondrinema litorale]|uniref:alkaline phosphatase PhoX n=1 Tax=Chondrinema litorale TaxID=2994555 RepID=UPI0025433BD4|nr:alkaline phosphatase PhoX [Chondrinema litorale]UZR97931.1 DUF839 domain-containing protein [Chondrinema litorale]
MPTRRGFIKQSGIISLGFMGLQQFACTPATQKEQIEQVGYGAMLKDVDGILNLPKGFSYKIISQMGNKMSDGFYLPGLSDGMATFSENGKTLLVRNHELSPGDMERSPYGKDGEFLSKLDKSLIYDFGKGEKISVGGTTTAVFNEKSQKVETEYLSLTGTIRNCAGGPTPWGSWITCEETQTKADDIIELDHGYNFEVKATSKIGLQKAIPLKAMGRFTHEAIAVDPATSIVYQTEDAGDAIIYRFIPEKKGDLTKGKLQALCIIDHPSYDTRNWPDLTTEPFPRNQPFKVTWIDLEDIDAPESDLRLRGYENGAARFARSEGMWYDNGELYFACTNGGKQNNGQIFKYLPGPYEGTDRENEQPGTLELFIESDDADILEHGDNLTISPWGDVIICEDKPATPKIVGVTPKGQLYTLAENIGFKSEFAGACFSPTGDTLFVNIQGPGLTVAIQGPWKNKIIS